MIKYARSAGLLARTRAKVPPPPNPRIRLSFEEVTPGEDDEEPEVETGWEDEEGVEISFEDDGEPLAGQRVAAAVRVLRRYGPLDPSSSTWQEPPVHVWYTQTTGDENYQTGARRTLSFHPEGFTAAEGRAIFNEITRRQNPVRRTRKRTTMPAHARSR
jgi:hypothetical protein